MKFTDKDRVLEAPRNRIQCKRVLYLKHFGKVLISRTSTPSIWINLSMLPIEDKKNNEETKQKTNLAGIIEKGCRFTRVGNITICEINLF